MPAFPDDPLSRARLQALRLLKVRPRTEAELRSRLSRKRVPDPVADRLLDELKAKGLVNDAQFARYFAAQQMDFRPVGRRGLLTRLRAKGVPPALAAEAAAGAVAAEDELAAARRLASQRAPRLAGLGPAAAQRRLFGFLSRRGFSSEVIWKVLREPGGGAG